MYACKAYKLWVHSLNNAGESFVRISVMPFIKLNVLQNNMKPFFKNYTLVILDMDANTSSLLSFKCNSYLYVPGFNIFPTQALLTKQ